MANYTNPYRLNELDDVSVSITRSSLYLVQDEVGNRLGRVTAPDIVGITSIDDIQDGVSFKKVTAAQQQEIIQLRTELDDLKSRVLILENL